LRVVLFQKLFKGYIFCFLGDSVGRCIFEQFARETNLKKKRSVPLCVQHSAHQYSCYEYSVENPFCILGHEMSSHC
jgi:hypothetical protein